MTGPTRRAVLAGTAGLVTGPQMRAAAAPDSRTGPVSCPGAAGSWLVPFASAPFPYDGRIGGTDTKFLDRRDGGRRGHTSPRGGLYWEDTTYSDDRVLLGVPRRVDPASATIVLYLHGNQATLEATVCRQQGVPRQVAASGLPAVLVAPQLAVNALDSSAGKFWQPGALGVFLAEAARQFGALGYPGLEGAPVIIVAYSGGYLPAVFGLEIGGVADRVRGLVLLDALFGEVPRYAEVIARNTSRIAFVSASSASSREANASLRRLLDERGIPSGEGLPRTLQAGSVAFVSAPSGTSHGEFMTRGFVRDPLAAVLRAFAGGSGR